MRRWLLMRVGRALAKADGRNVVFMTDFQLAAWRAQSSNNCEIRYGDRRALDVVPKLAQVGPLGRQTKDAVARRSGGLCELKSSRCTRVATDIHHLVFKSRGGTNELENLAHTCGPCHRAVHSASDPPRGGDKALKRESVTDFLLRKIKW